MILTNPRPLSKERRVFWAKGDPIWCCIVSTRETDCRSDRTSAGDFISNVCGMERELRHFHLENSHGLISRRGSDSTCTRSWKWRKPTSPVFPCLKISKPSSGCWFWLFCATALFPSLSLILPELQFQFPGRLVLPYSQLFCCSTTAVRQTP